MKDKKIKKKKIELSEKLLPIKEDFKKTFSWRIFKIMAEFVAGFEFISKLDKKSASIFGATRFLPDHPDYQKAQKMGKLLAQEGYTVITGGGPGIMEAANRGASEAGGQSIGMNIELPSVQRSNHYLNHSTSFYYFFTRKVMISFSSSVYLFFPGGYGTLDEFFEMIVLLQTRKLSHSVIIIAVGKDYWQPFFTWLEKDVCGRHQAITKKELKLFKLVDTPEEAMAYIKSNGPMA